MPFFSIIIPTYNSGRTLQKCLESVINQTFSDFEILIMDGISTDNTMEIVKGFNDERIKFFSEKDEGVYDAMNKGINRANGEWLYFLGSDDELYDEYILDKVYNKTIQTNYDFVYGNVLKVLSNIIYDNEFDLKKLFYKNICHQAIFFNKRLFDKTGLYNIKYKSRADYALNIHIFSNDYKIMYIPLIIARFNEGGFSSNYFDLEFWNDYNDNYLKPFKKILPKRELYSILWIYIYELITLKQYYKACKIFFKIPFHIKNTYAYICMLAAICGLVSSSILSLTNAMSNKRRS